MASNLPAGPAQAQPFEASGSAPTSPGPASGSAGPASGSTAAPSAARSAHPPRTTLVRQIGSFLLVGAVCTAASVAIFALLRPAAGVQWANLVSLVLTSLLNTELNRRHSFGIRDKPRWFTDHRRGLWVMLVALGLTSGSLWLLHALVADASVLDELLTITAANVLAAVTRFLLLRYWIFRRVRRHAPGAAAATPRHAPTASRPH